MTVHAIHLASPAATWDEGLPLGNGLLGALVWGDGGPLKLSLDRTDLWDLRPVPEWESPDYTYATVRRWHAEGRHAELTALLESPYRHPGPTRIPAGRLELVLGGKVLRSHLDTRRAVAEVVAEGVDLRLFVHATRPVGLGLCCGATPPLAGLIPPDFAGTRRHGAGPADTGGLPANALSLLGYAAGTCTAGPDWQRFVQPTWGGTAYAVEVAWRRVSATSTLIAWSVARGGAGEDPAAACRAEVAAALAEGWEAMLATHEAWWAQYWTRSAVRLPDAVVEELWHHEQYRFAAASRRGAPPISLQGPWTADDGQLPPWKGDYHHDLNSELSYWPCYAANHLEEGLAFLDWLWATRDEALAWTRSFWRKPGLNVPMTVDLAGRNIGGWRQYTHSATTAAWLAHHFWLHWRYSQDRGFLRNRAWPWLRDCAVFLEAVTEHGPDGWRTLPLSSSPEMHGNEPRAWFPGLTNYDLALIRWLMGATAGLAHEVGEPAEAVRWQGVLAELPELALDGDGSLLVAAGEPLTESHRHHSNLVAIHPLGLVDATRSPADRQTAATSLANLDRLGPGLWTGYSWAWLGCLRARSGDGVGAADAVRIFRTAFCGRNGFHLNGDQTGTKRYSTFGYRPFTLEGNFAAAAAVQEMLLQSHGGVIEPFPAIPPDWQEAAFTLLAEGGFLVSAELRQGRLHHVSVHAEHGGCGSLRLAADHIADFRLQAGETAYFEA